MSRKKILENLGISLVLFLLVAVFRYKFFSWLLFFGLGGIIGTFILECEGVILTKLEVREKVFHTYLFQVIFAILTLYVLTSTASAFASGVCLFAFLSLLRDKAEGGFFGLVVPFRWLQFWVGGGILLLCYFVYILVR